MIRWKLFSGKGLRKFKENIAKNICHASVNSESASWLTLSAGLCGSNTSSLDQILIKSVEHLYDDPTEFDSRFTPVETIPIEFWGLRDLFFTYFIRRLPVMLSGRSLSWHRPKSPAKSEIVDVCEYCIIQYTRDIQTTKADFTSRFREGYEAGFRWTRLWIRCQERDAFYYDTGIIENFVAESLEALLELRYPTSIRTKSDQMQRIYEQQAEWFHLYSHWFRLNRHVFIDKLADHLQLAYPIYSSKAWTDHES